QLLAILELVDAGLAAAELLVLPVQLADQLLELGGDQIEERAHLALLQTPEGGLAERLLLQIERRELHRSEDTAAVKVCAGSGGRSGVTAARTPPRCSAFTRYIASSARLMRFSGSRAS